LVPADVARALDTRLALFEQETTHQIVVAIFPELPWEPMETFTRRTANAWGVGQKGQNNGVVLFVFVKDRRLRLEVGLGLETVLTHEVCQSILDETITPSFKAKQYAEGLTAALDAIIARLTSSNPEATRP
jgi:uncharacterized protein